MDETIDATHKMDLYAQQHFRQLVQKTATDLTFTSCHAKTIMQSLEMAETLALLSIVGSAMKVIH